ncbi:MAG: LacI family DNA-binding transcriptional regulator [Massiliimalia sp.]|jgi:LacI family transcriptional regulator
MTIKDIAALAGVSKSTVSRVLTNTGYVNEDTRKKIQSVIERYGYQPSASAQNLPRKETNTIGIVIPEMDNYFFTDIVRGISQVADPLGLTMIYSNTDNQAEKESKVLEMLKSQRVRGVIMTPATDYSQPDAAKHLKEQLEKLQVPIVMVDRTVKDTQYDGVFFNNMGGAYAATQTLIQAGNRKIGVITGDLQLKIGRDRFHGFCQCMKDHGLSIPQDRIYEGNFQTETAYQLAKQIFARQDPLDAVVTCNNNTTLGVIKAAHELGKVLGVDLALMGIDRIDVLDLIGYSYSCIARDPVEMGRKAMDLLLRRIQSPDAAPSVCTVRFEIICKGSEKKPIR